jgi:hypothetical protein
MGKPKKINFELIPASDGDYDSEPYQVLDTARKAHREVNEARIGLAWRKREKRDLDGHVVLGRCVKIGDLYKEYMEFDFVIVLNRDVWESPEWTDERKLALVDHEMCHVAHAEDEDGNKIDERGRPVWRLRKHDIEEFGDIVERHGTYKRDLERFAELLLKKKRTPLFSTVAKIADLEECPYPGCLRPTDHTGDHGVSAS